MDSNTTAVNELQTLQSYYEQVKAATGETLFQAKTAAGETVYQDVSYRVPKAIVERVMELTGSKEIMAFAFVSFGDDFITLDSTGRQLLLRRLEECIKNAKATQRLN